MTSVKYKGNLLATESRGGFGGIPFEISPYSNDDSIIKITIGENDQGYVGKLKVEYSGSHTEETGLGESGLTSLALESGEYFNNVIIRSGDYVNHLKIITNKNRHIEVGQIEGGITAHILENRKVIGFYGTTGSWCDGLGVLYEKI
ncbi:jacalin-related lectin 3 [Anaeramoeba flamelloides]|uniref:Jacalin-related lectin n=1 Tax=Anaeramoeba flamelloides TaxID=1746091 RepID=A0AAV7ZUB2_9EUKA|nr:jacalin-related lectin [Anaeramoeba flamelloides]KAJ6242973.1 jacalin-related lectin 3 [Anaeramoeba flamelloides]|eukprot:Anaeramoba_flamelloidesa1055772_108.p1 GENE.a1055772_108~~a1055772_108.p1  ORF type:complete len:146 (+),score=25.78 a1055772_108:59-496(+)